jgi:endonuclease/exonuclease/phosphatase family metal-dependent hydrolase
MRSACLLVLVTACVADDLPGEPEQPAESTIQSAVAAGPHNLRVATFNIHYGIRVNPDLWDPVHRKGFPGYDLPYDNLAMVTSQIRSANADVVLLQEVFNHYPDGGCDDQPRRLVELLGDLYPYSDYAPDYAQATISCGRLWSVTGGQMILSKLPFAGVPTNTPLEQQSGRYGFTHVQSAKVVKDGVAFRLYNTHFATDEDENKAEFIALRQHIDATVGDGVVIAAGDYNFDRWTETAWIAPMTSRPLWRHGAGIDHMWTDWPWQYSEGTFPMTSPISASDHPMMWWDLSWVGDHWITLGQKSATGFGMNSAPSSSSSGGIYARNGSTWVRGRKIAMTEPWIPDPRVGNPADGAYRVTNIPNDPNGCELVGWRDGTFKWAFETGGSCQLSQPISTSQWIQSAPAIASFSRFLFLFGSFITFHDYFVFTTTGAGAIAWSHYEGTSPTPPPTAFTTWNVQADSLLAKAYSAPAVITPGLMFGGGCPQIFVRDIYDRIRTRSLCYNGSYTWSAWTDLDRPSPWVSVASNPSAAAAGWSGMHACVIGTDHQIWCRSAVNNVWDPTYRSCGAPEGGAFGDPVVAMEGNDLIVYVRNRNDRIFLRRCNR